MHIDAAYREDSWELPMQERDCVLSKQGVRFVENLFVIGIEQVIVQ